MIFRFSTLARRGIGAQLYTDLFASGTACGVQPLLNPEHFPFVHRIQPAIKRKLERCTTEPSLGFSPIPPSVPNQNRRLADARPTEAHPIPFGVTIVPPPNQHPGQIPLDSKKNHPSRHDCGCLELQTTASLQQEDAQEQHGGDDAGES